MVSGGSAAAAALAALALASACSADRPPVPTKVLGEQITRAPSGASPQPAGDPVPPTTTTTAGPPTTATPPTVTHPPSGTVAARRTAAPTVATTVSTVRAATTTGVVTGASVPGARVSISQPGGAAQTVVVGARGVFTFTEPPGTYDVVVTIVSTAPPCSPDGTCLGPAVTATKTEVVVTAGHTVRVP